MVRRRRFGWCCALVLAFAALFAVLAYRFVVVGSTEPGDSVDGRTVIRLDPGERALVLAEMRRFLAGIQGISQALTRRDMEAAARIARDLGGRAVAGIPASLMTKLPLQFKQLGRGVHNGFDRLAQDAEQHGDAERSLRQMAEILSICVACHSVYQLRPAPAP